MKIEILKEAIDLSETLNFTKTAANRYITQPALSRHIAGLEEELGVTLFDRSKHDVQLTAEGMVLVQQMRKITAEYDKLIATIGLLGEGFTSTLRVGYVVSASRPFLAHASALFEKRYPNVHVEYEPLSPKGVRQALAKESIDLAFTASTFLSADSSLARESIYEVDYCLAVSRESPLAGRDSLSLEELSDLEIAMPERPFAPAEHEIFQNVFSRINYKPSKRTYRGIEDIPVVLSTGADVLPVLSYVRYYGDQSFVLVPFRDNPLPAASVIAVHDVARTEPAIGNFITCAHEGYALTAREEG